MFKYLFYTIISAIVIIIFVFQSIIIRKQANLLNRSNDVVEHANLKDILNQSFINIWKIERSPLNIEEIYDENEQKATVFSENDHPVLLFRFFISNCAPCDVHQTNIINELQSTSLKYKLICNHLDSKQGLFTFKRMNRISEIVYSSKKLIDGESGSIFFCIYYQGVVSDIFFPNEHFPDLTKSYLNEMEIKYFTNCSDGEDAVYPQRDEKTP